MRRDQGDGREGPQADAGHRRRRGGRAARGRVGLSGRLTLFERPTPVREVPELGLWVKDDSVIGGNKVRKLEHTLADALARGRRSVLTFGAIGSNHCVATAEQARAVGLACVLVLVDQPEDEHVSANLARMRAAGARIVRAGTTARAALVLPWLLARHRPYVLPVGGSSRVGVRGFIEAGDELAAQVRAGELPEPRTLVVAVGSGGTAAGLSVGLARAGLRPRLVGVLVNDRTRVDVRRLAHRAAPDVQPLPVEIRREWLGDGYGHATAAGAAATARARAAGLVLEPVYTAKAMAAALALEPERPVLFWQTFSAA